MMPLDVLILVVGFAMCVICWRGSQCLSDVREDMRALCANRHSLAGILADPPFTKTELEEELFSAMKDDPACKNTSREDIRNVIAKLGDRYRTLHDSQVIAQTRQMRKW